MVDPDGHWSWLKFAYSTVRGAVNGYISAKVTGRNIFLSTMAGAVTGAVSGIGEALFATPSVVGDIAKSVFNGISAGIGSIFDQLLDGKSIKEIDYHDVIISAIVGAVGSFASKISEKMSEAMLDMYNKLSDIFEGYVEAAPWVKDVLTEIYNIIFVDLPENVVSETLTGGD